MRLRRYVGVAAATVAASAALAPAGAQARQTTRISDFSVSTTKLNVLRDRFLSQLEQRNAAGSWAPLRFELGNRELKLLGLPDKRTLLRWRARGGDRLRAPTVFRSTAARGGKGGGGNSDGGGSQTTATPLVNWAGAGWLGIRPGAFLLLINGNSIGWCTTAHVYGSPGAYDISTAGHCGKPGDIASVVGLVGDRLPVVLDFGRFAVSHDNGPGDDWALIDIAAPYQPLTTPTAAFWGGPRGMFTATGAAATVNVPNRLPGTPSVSVNPNPFLVQQIVHFGHGTGIGAGGTPRSGTAIHWGTRHFMFFGVVSPGDSGSFSNTVLGDSVGANMEAAGINTHIWVDPLMRNGLGIMAGTRSTQVSGTLANGQIVPYPAPTPVPLP